MWPLPKVNERRLQIVLCADRVTYALFKHTDSKRIEVLAYVVQPLTSTPSGLLWDLPTLHQQTADVITTYNLAGAYVQVVLVQPLVQETLVYTIKNVATQEELVAEPLAHHWYSHTLLGPYEDHYLFYVARIARALLLQIELLFVHLPVHLESVLTGFAAQLNLYKFIKGPAYRSVELTYAINHNSIDLTKNFAEDVASLLMRNATQSDDVYYALGSFLGES